MRKFSCVIGSENGIHARPAGFLVKAASEFKSSIELLKGEKKASAKSLFSIMGLGVKNGDELEVIIEGEDDEAAESSIKSVFETKLNTFEFKDIE